MSTENWHTLEMARVNTLSYAALRTLCLTLRRIRVILSAYSAEFIVYIWEKQQWPTLTWDNDAPTTLKMGNTWILYTIAAWQ